MGAPPAPTEVTLSFWVATRDVISESPLVPGATPDADVIAGATAAVATWSAGLVVDKWSSDVQAWSTTLVTLASGSAWVVWIPSSTVSSA